MSKKGRELTQAEIDTLISNGCTSENWTLISVSDDFKSDKLRNVSFYGENYIGAFRKKIKLYGGIEVNSGIYDCALYNCTIGNDVLINKTNNYIANYNIEDNVIIDNIDMLAVEGESTFGNAVEVAVLNEGGGREILIYDHLSAHLAYMLSLYRHSPNLIFKINKMINRYAKSVKSTIGTIEKGAVIRNCKTLKNIKVGAFAEIQGVNKLENGTVNSSAVSPVLIGEEVNAKNFIVCEGSKITEGALLLNCFVGQSCEIGKNFSAENSLFFANCHCFMGEACAVFAGPYTATHHKSTLLIAGLYSFLNAGSGTNQSNHMYKLGPVHQGILARGCKTSSDSYILWPAKIGAFTVIMGRHYKNSDTSDFPFSYLIESKDESVLVPGANIQSVGTIRDVQKWPQRDKRTTKKELDFINFNLLSPFTLQRVIKGRNILSQLKDLSGEDSESYTYNSVIIKNSSLKNGQKLYQQVINKFIGNSIISRLKKCDVNSLEDLRKCLKNDNGVGKGKWVDIAGLIAPKTEIDKLTSSIEKSEIRTLKQIHDFFSKLHSKYYDYEWNWVWELIQDEEEITDDSITFQDVIRIVEKWKKSVVDIDEALYVDAKKEFTLLKKTGFGIDGDDLVKSLDFEYVRGDFEKHPVVKEIRDHIIRKSELGDSVIEKMRNLSIKEDKVNVKFSRN